MPAPTKGPRLGGGPAHERLLLANLATALFEHGRITTTEAKAKRLRPLAERLVTFAKRGDLHARRQVLTVVRDKAVVHTLFADIAPRYAERQGGYTRIVKLGPRKGDNAPMALIELVEGRTVAQEAVAEGEAARRTRFARRRRPTGATAEAAADLAAESDTAAGVAAEAEAAEATEAGEAAEATQATDAGTAEVTDAGGAAVTPDTADEAGESVTPAGEPAGGEEAPPADAAEGDAAETAETAEGGAAETAETAEGGAAQTAGGENPPEA